MAYVINLPLKYQFFLLNGNFFSQHQYHEFEFYKDGNPEFQVLVIKIQEYESESCQRVGRFESKCFH